MAIGSSFAGTDACSYAALPTDSPLLGAPAQNYGTGAEDKIDYDVRKRGMFEFRVPKGVPIEFLNLHYDLSQEAGQYGLRNVRYKLKNHGTDRVVAVALWADAYSGSEIRRVVQHYDSWIAPDGGLVASGSVEFDPVSFRNSIQIEKVVITLVYAEFETGRRTGANAESFHSALSKYRQTIQDEYSNLKSALEQGNIDLLELNKPSYTAPARFDARVRILGILRKSGRSAALADIDRVLQQRP